MAESSWKLWKRNIFQNFDMFVWTSGFKKSLAQTEFNMFLDEWTSANESPEDSQLTKPLMSISCVYILQEPF